MATDFTKTQDYVNFKESHKKMEQPAEFAKFFVEAAKEQTSIKEVIKDNIIDALKNNEEAKTALKEIIRNVEKEDHTFLLNRVWQFLKYVGTAAVTLVITLIAQNSGRTPVV